MRAVELVTSVILERDANYARDLAKEILDALANDGVLLEPAGMTMLTEHLEATHPRMGHGTSFSRCPQTACAELREVVELWARTAS